MFYLPFVCARYGAIAMHFRSISKLWQVQCFVWMLMINCESVRYNPISVTHSPEFASGNGTSIFFNVIFQPTHAICLRCSESHRELRLLNHKWHLCYLRRIINYYLMNFSNWTKLQRVSIDSSVYIVCKWHSACLPLVLHKSVFCRQSCQFCSILLEIIGSEANVCKFTDHL